MRTDNPRDRLVDDILRRAAADPQFRARLLNDPNAAIYDAFGIRVPDRYHVKFVEREPGLDALVVLPDSVSEGGAADGELGDSDLEAISGGVSPHYMWALDFNPGGSDGDAETGHGQRGRRDPHRRAAGRRAE